MSIIKNQNFVEQAEKAIESIVTQIDQQDEDCIFEIESEADGTSINTESGIYLINIKATKKEIWLSSPITGPHHFYQYENHWYSKNGDDLGDILSSELSDISQNHPKIHISL